MTIRPVMVYLAGPQDDVSGEEARDWREGMPELAPAGMVFYSPAHAYIGTSPANFPAVDIANRHAIVFSDAVIANISGPGRAFGTIREIEFATLLGKPVAVVGTVVSLMSHDLMVCYTLEEAVSKILERVSERREEPPWIKTLREMGVLPPD